MHRGRFIAAALVLVALTGTAARQPRHRTGSFGLTIPSGPFIAGSRLPVDAPSISGPVALSVIGPGSIDSGQFIAPLVTSPTTSTLIAATQGAVAYSTLRIVPPPLANRPLIAVAAYENGVALHDPKTFALLGYAPIGGPPGDVAFARDGTMYAPDTDGESLARIVRKPWQMLAIQGVLVGNEVAVDDRTGNVFVSNRDLNGAGAVTRIAPDGSVARVDTGITAEGLAVDSARGMVYVGNVNDNSVAQVDERSMRVVRKIRAVERTFGIAFDAKLRRLFVVSNSSPSMQGGAGYLAALDLRRPGAPIIMKNRAMKFPLGVALDAQHGRVFVTDESTDQVYVVDERTLRTLRSPLQTCRTPWRPRVFGDRLYVPCTRSNSVDVFELSTLQRAPGAPFVTGGFPLSVALWP